MKVLKTAAALAAICNRIPALCLGLLLIAGNVAAAPISVTDTGGETLQLQQPARRIISLAPHTTELLFAAGAGERVVGAVSHSDYPAAARDIPRVGSAHQLDMERIIALQPELVVAWRSGNSAGQLQQLRQLNLPMYTSEPRSLTDIGVTIRHLGQLAGTETTAVAAAEDFSQRLANLRNRYADQSAVSVFYEIWPDPLITISGGHVIGEVIRLCGGRNVFADMEALAPRISFEAVLAAMPEVIIASGMGEERPEWLDKWRQWPQLPAVEHDQLHFIPPDILQRPTPRILKGADRMCEILARARRHYADQSGQ